MKHELDYCKPERGEGWQARLLRLLCAVLIAVALFVLYGLVRFAIAYLTQRS